MTVLEGEKFIKHVNNKTFVAIKAFSSLNLKKKNIESRELTSFLLFMRFYMFDIRFGVKLSFL